MFSDSRNYASDSAVAGGVSDIKNNFLFFVHSLLLLLAECSPEHGNASSYGFTVTCLYLLHFTLILG